MNPGWAAGVPPHYLPKHSTRLPRAESDLVPASVRPPFAGGMIATAPYVDLSPRISL
jgi:hypothetical protein